MIAEVKFAEKFAAIFDVTDSHPVGPPSTVSPALHWAH
jgi:hypothetical protein